jgi:glycosyltransferase involved in cell wall biosynthesis
VSIGLAVYNGEDYLEEAIRSILAQTFTDFELIISDNASSDRTEEICEKFAAMDERVLYSRNAHNIGGMKNANRTFELAHGEYFRFTAHDDYCAPTLLERCVEALDANPDVTVCVTGVVSVDANGNELDVRHPRKGMDRRASDRFRDLLVAPYFAEATSGLVRSAALKQTRLHGNYTGSDYVLNCELALLGRWLLVDELLFFKRRHDGNAYQDLRGRMAWSRPDLASSGRPTFPTWLQLYGYARALSRAPLPQRDRALCAGSTVQWAWRKRRALGGDVLLAAWMVLHSKRWRRARYEEERWR